MTIKQGIAMELGGFVQLFVILIFPGYILSHKLDPGVNCTEVTYWVGVSGREIVGGVKTRIENVNITSCKQRCIQYPDACKTFDLIPLDNACEIHSVQEGDPGTMIQNAPDKVHYFQKNICDDTDMDSSHGDEIDDDDDDDDDKSQFMRWVEDKPEYIILVSMLVLVVLLLIVIIGLIIVLTQNRHKWEVKTKF